ncbi:MAG: hypothetical protein C7B47_06870 [Sulfobacillus thermosulfidooxidans]|uniref:N-acetyltransferase domain-containing protein n=1 Tax=Sulfobacillus thermosulfidooxidans TaxID=28034 RepID=A0A2T2X0G9_SULTH|nr:MAG: hypothetical protein C7B47_06870 [Sulfobacillus thermosulfidooxidans]
MNQIHSPEFTHPIVQDAQDTQNAPCITRHHLLFVQAVGDDRPPEAVLHHHGRDSQYAAAQIYRDCVATENITASQSRKETMARFHNTLPLHDSRFWGYGAYYNDNAVGALGAFRPGNTVGLYSGFTVPEWRGRGLSREFADEVVQNLQEKGFQVICQCRPDLERFYAKMSAGVTARWERWDL